MRSHGSGTALIANTAGCADERSEREFTAYWFDGAIKRKTEFQLVLDETKKRQYLHVGLNRSSSDDFARLSSQFKDSKIYCRVSNPDKTSNEMGDEPLLKLGDALAVSSYQFSNPNTLNIPAAYTYLGQFIAHEVSNLETLDDNSIPARTGALDLDTLFDAPEPKSKPGQAWVGGVGVGRVSDPNNIGEYSDLPREQDGSPIIRDMRNDHNLGIAQVHMLLSKFHQIVFTKVANQDLNEAKSITTKYIQSIILFDFLRRIIDRKTYFDVLTNGRRVIYPNEMNHHSRFMIPIEFSAACFRLGHSMVRTSYERWNGERPANIGELIRFTSDGGGLEDGRLPSDWVLDWGSMIDTPQGTTAVTNLASAIDHFIAYKMAYLDKSQYSDYVQKNYPNNYYLNISSITMIRGYEYDIPPGQEVLRSVNEMLRNDDYDEINELTHKEICAIPHVDESKPNAKSVLMEFGLHEKTPLWFYCVREAAHFHSGQCFGPLAGRIAMETIHASIEASENSIITGGKNIECSNYGVLGKLQDFNFRKLIDLVEREWCSENFS